MRPVASFRGSWTEAVAGSIAALAASLGCARLGFASIAGVAFGIIMGRAAMRLTQKPDPWPTKVGIDEHLFKHDSRLNTRRFVTMIVDHKNKRLMEVVEGKEGAVLKAALEHIPGRKNVGWVALDLSDGYRKFAREFFPNAQLVADKFHVLRLVQPAIYRYIKQLELGRDAPPLYKLLRRS